MTNGTLSRPIYTDVATGCLYTVNPANGQLLWIIDSATGSPLAQQPLYTDNATGCLYVISAYTGQPTWVIDPMTGQPMRGFYPQPATSPAYAAQTPAGGQAESRTVYGQSDRAREPLKTSGLAIAGLILGILAFLLSFIPVVNFCSPILGIVGIVLSIIGLVGISQGKANGKAMAIVGLVLSVLSLIVVFLFAASIVSYSSPTSVGSNPPSISSSSHGSGSHNSGSPHSSGSSSNSSSSTNSSSSKGSSSSSEDLSNSFDNMAIGESVQLGSGLVLTVNSVEHGLINFDGEMVTGVNVTYSNQGSSTMTFSENDWMAQDANGALRSNTYYSEAAAELGYGSLVPGGAATGDIYFEGDVGKIFFYDTYTLSEPSIAWAI